MARWKQYELWVPAGNNKWEIVGAFPTTELPTAMASARSTRARVIEVLYEGSKVMGQEVVVEIGIGREPKSNS